MNEKVDEIVNDFNKVGYPYKAGITVDLVDFVKNFFDDGKPGFPNVFKEAMEMYYTVYECHNPGGGYKHLNGNPNNWVFSSKGCSEFTSKNGAGKIIYPFGSRR